jgi:hypothetical protein
LLVNASQSSSKVLESVLNHGYFIIVGVNLLSVLIFELLNLAFDLIKLLLKGLDVGVKLVLDVTTLLFKIIGLFFNSSSNLVSLLEGCFNSLCRVIVHLVLVVFVEHQHPLN